MPEPQQNVITSCHSPAFAVVVRNVALLFFLSFFYTQGSRDWFIDNGQFFADAANSGDLRDLSTSFSMTYKPETLLFKKKTQDIVD
ncbi:MAG: hypothetical protein P8H31_05690 [Porticoccaceae bacterium]|nr:hypothetical protein [Porticoccaceae bacterium]